MTQALLHGPGMWVWGAHPDTQRCANKRAGTPCLLTESHAQASALTLWGRVAAGDLKALGKCGGGWDGDSPSNSAWPTPMMMMDMGSLAACKTTGDGRVRGIWDPAEGPLKGRGDHR